MTARNKKKTEELRLDNLPEFTPELIEDLINQHIASEGHRHGRFHCGKRLGFGGSGIVYQLHYIPAEDEKGKAFCGLSLAVKGIDPIRSFLKTAEDSFQNDEKVENILKHHDFAPFLRGSRRVLESVAQCHDNRYYEHHFLHYYPDLSFSVDSVIPCGSIVVMDEIAGTLKNLTLPEDLSAIIRMIVKLGKEIGTALQASEYADDGTGFLHRDIKPSNIGIALNFNSPDVYEFVLIDIESGIPESSLLENSFTLVVNEFVRAPELSGQIDRDEIDYARVDMYNLGCTMKYIAGEKFNLLPEGLKRIIRKASNDDPSHRYDDGQELIEQLEKFELDYAKEGGSSVNISRFMDEQKELLDAEKRDHKAVLNELNSKLKKQREDIRDYKKQIKKWKKDYDLQMAHEESMDKEFNDYKKESENKISELSDEIERLKTALNQAAGGNAEPSKLIRRIDVKSNGMPLETIIREYDAKDRLISEKRMDSPDNATYRYTYSEEGMQRSRYRADVICETEVFDEKGNLLRFITFKARTVDKTLDYKYKYNRKGMVSGVYINDERREKHSYEYENDHVSVHRVETLLGNGDSAYRIETFNPDGTMHTLVTYSDLHDSEDSDYEKVIFTYDENGLETKAVYEDGNHQTVRERFRFYDRWSRMINEITMDYSRHDTTARDFFY